MTTLSDLIRTTSRYLMSGEREIRNQLSAGVAAGATTLNFTYSVLNLAPGVYLSVDLEIFYVWDVAASGYSATVIGGQLGSTPAAHNAGAIAYVNPKFTDFAIAQALNEELASLSSPINGLFAAKMETITYNPVIRAYDLSGVSGLLDVIQVRYKTPNPDQYFPPVRGWKLLRNQVDAYFGSGFALQMIRGGGFPGEPIYVLYKAPFAPLVNLTDDAVAVAGLPATAVDIPPVGAAIRMVAGREILRNFTDSESDPKRLEEVPAGAVAASVKNLMMLRAQRITEEAGRLAQAYPRES